MLQSLKRRVFQFAALTALSVGGVTMVSAQQPGAPMSEQQMQAMMAYMQAIQACTAGIDEAAMQARAEQFHQEVGQLCAAGKRDEAQSRVMEYAREMADDPQMQAMHECMKKSDSLKPDIPGMGPPPGADYSQIDTSQHVCDQP
jgi:hypothetical protein